MNTFIVIVFINICHYIGLFMGQYQSEGDLENIFIVFIISCHFMVLEHGFFIVIILQKFMEICTSYQLPALVPFQSKLIPDLCISDQILRLYRQIL